MHLTAALRHSKSRYCLLPLPHIRLHGLFRRVSCLEIRHPPHGHADKWKPYLPITLRFPVFACLVLHLHLAPATVLSTQGSPDLYCGAILNKWLSKINGGLAILAARGSIPSQWYAVLPAADMNRALCHFACFCSFLDPEPGLHPFSRCAVVSLCILE